MAGNTNDPPRTLDDTAANPSGGSGTRIIVSTMPEVREASLKVAKSAQRLLSIFTQDLEPLIYGEEPFLEAIKRLVLARSYAKVRVLLADPSPAMVDNNRFLALARRLTSCIDMRSMSPEYPASAGASARPPRPGDRSLRGFYCKWAPNVHNRVRGSTSPRVLTRTNEGLPMRAPALAPAGTDSQPPTSTDKAI